MSSSYVTGRGPGAFISPSPAVPQLHAAAQSESIRVERLRSPMRRFYSVLFNASCWQHGEFTKSPSLIHSLPGTHVFAEASLIALCGGWLNCVTWPYLSNERLVRWAVVDYYAPSYNAREAGLATIDWPPGPGETVSNMFYTIRLQHVLWFVFLCVNAIILCVYLFDKTVVPELVLRATGQ